MTAVDEHTAASIYPLAAANDDPRFSLGLVLDVADVLVAHGYPRPGTEDWVDLQQALYGFLHARP